MMIKCSVGPDTERGQDRKTSVIKSKERLEFSPWSCLCGFLFWLWQMDHGDARQWCWGRWKLGEGYPRLFCTAFADFPGSSATTCKAGDPGLIPGSGRSPGKWIGYSLQYSWASLVAQSVKNPPAMQETWVWSLGWEDHLEEGMATHSIILAWRIPKQRHLVGCSPWGHKELDTTEWLSTAQYKIISN